MYNQKPLPLDSETIMCIIHVKFISDIQVDALQGFCNYQNMTVQSIATGFSEANGQIGRRM